MEDQSDEAASGHRCGTGDERCRIVVDDTPGEEPAHTVLVERQPRGPGGGPERAVQIGRHAQQETSRSPGLRL